jgi:hypothetical protein
MADFSQVIGSSFRHNDWTELTSEAIIYPLALEWLQGD